MALSLLVWSCAEPPSPAADDRSGRSSVPTQSQVGGSETWDALPEGWSKLAPPPFVRARAVSVWTGNELIYWGGDTGYGGTHHADGAAYDPVAGKWRELPPAPISGRSSAGAVWTGQEVLIWGGSSDEPVGDGAAYSPADNTWRKLADSPLRPRDPVAAVWTGSEMIVWGSTRRTEGSADGAAYDPVAGRWRSIADAPLKLNLASAVWTGKEVIAYGALLDNNNASASDHARGIAYAPSTDTWRVLPSFPLSPQASSAVWTGTEMIVWDYELAAGAYDPIFDRWRDLPNAPLDFMECYPSSAFSDYLMIAHYCSDGVLFDVDFDQWARFGWPDGIVAGRPVAADGVFFFAGATHEGTHNALWAYKSERDPGWPDCGVISLTRDEYGTRLDKYQGLPGDIVTLSGTTLRGEDGRYAPSDRLEAWWNSEVPRSEVPDAKPIGDGPVVKLVEVDDMERCEFEAQFTVPDVEPGRYAISVMAWDQPPSDGYGWFLPHEFEVLPDRNE